MNLHKFNYYQVGLEPNLHGSADKPRQWQSTHEIDKRTFCDELSYMN